MVFTLVISFIPLFWGTSTYVNVDYTLILFFIYLMYAEYKGQAILMAFWTIALLLNKETGWMIVAGYYMIYLLKQWKKTKGANFGLKVKGIFSNKVVWVILAGLFAVFIYMKYVQYNYNHNHATELFSSHTHKRNYFFPQDCPVKPIAYF